MYELQAVRQLERIADALEAIGEMIRKDRAAHSPQAELDLSPAVEPSPAADLENDLPWKNEAPTVPPTKEAVAVALNILAKTHGVDVGKRVLQDFGVSRLSDLPADKRQAVIDACKALT
jgi:hypothetical protein